MSWTKISAPSLPKSLTDGIPTAIDAVNSLFAGVLGVLETLTRTLSTLQSFATVSPFASAVRAAINQIQDLIGSLLADQGGIYYLNVPIISVAGKPKVPVIPVDVLAANNQAIPTNTLSVINMLQSGGNLGFYNVVADSLSDTLDSERPQLKSRDPVTGLVMLFGSAQIGVALDSALAIATLLGTLGTGLDRSLPLVPQTLRIRKTPGKKEYTLSWDTPFLERTLDELGSFKLRVKRTYVYRKAASKGPLPITATNAYLETYKIDTLDPNISTFTDSPTDDEPLYNYCVGYQLEAVSSDESVTVLRQIALSNMVTTPIPRRRHIAPYSRGVPPDWYKIAKGIDLFPALQEFLVFVQQYIDSFSASLADVGSSLTTVSIALKRMIARNEKVLTDIANYIDRILLSLAEPPEGLYVAAFNGQGGNSFMLAQLAHLLSDKSDSNRPPFDIGSELVGGVVLVASSSAAPGLSLLFEFLGASSSTPSPLKTAIDSISRVTATAPGKPVIGHDGRVVAIGSNFTP